jgi:hypothetical protein
MKVGGRQDDQWGFKGSKPHGKLHNVAASESGSLITVACSDGMVYLAGAPRGRG